MTKTFYLCLFLIISFTSYAQVDHWESIIREDDSWKFMVPTSQPSSSWYTNAYDDSEWNEGQAGFGYGDNDDNTVLPDGTIAVLLRYTFNIDDQSIIEDALLHLDYDDGFVAYLNGVEIDRKYLTAAGDPAYNELASEIHEAVLYQGQVPEAFSVDPDLFIKGDNVLAIEVHNQSSTSSDFSAIPVLSVAVNVTNTTFKDLPSWFQEPLNFTQSTLPIVVIDTEGQEILDDPKVTAHIGIISNGEGEINHLNDEYNEYSGFCGIELRGESSLTFAKKSYGFEMWDEEGEDMDTSFLDFPAEEDFILYGPYADKSLMNNRLAMQLANDMGHYASRTRYLELVINGEYMGVYVLMEKIKRGGDRVDINKLKEDEIEGDDLTGGYIIRVDKGVHDGWASQYDAYNRDYKLFFQYFYPDEEDIQPEQEAYIKSYVDEFEAAMAARSGFNAQGKHYTSYMDLNSFVDNFIINELSKNVDAYRLSSYFYKDKDSNGGKLTCGYWDFNLSFGNADYCGGDDTSGWIYYQCQEGSPFWWNELLQDSLFTNALKCRWEQLRSTTLSNSSLMNDIDNYAAELEEAQVRNYQRWPVLGTYLWPNPWYYSQAATYDDVITAMKGWLTDRLAWLDNNMPGEANHCELYEDFDELNLEDIVSSVEELNSGMKLYPNPAGVVINIESKEIMNEVLVTNLSGKVLATYQPKAYQYQIDLEKYKSGLYLVTIRTSNNTVIRKIEVVK
ncbi:CotH kinase family protein [Fulvivirga ligni]|uniref:CotH kinase family protein n=1 Tax=Fulvivirga ligni TaxID=2904246 RepID=UPI001F1E9C54|nr:CotH kinase family protein [Fulvivirga ligni]UII19200.1 CotH kinase family protein [Fulvivirga ligni]